MTQNEFHKLVHLVMDSKAHPPENLFAGGMDNWRARARLAHFLAMDEIDKKDEADELFHSVVETDYNEEISEEVEEYAFALQKLSALEKEQGKFDEALSHINQAIEAAEGTDFLYKYILRGELWADRWNLMHKMNLTADAEKEVHHVVAGGVVGVDLDLRTDIDNGDVLLDHLLQHLEHLLALLLAIVLQEESLDEIQFGPFHGTVGFHDGGNKDHEGDIDVGLRAGVAIGTAVGVERRGGLAVGGECSPDKVAEQAADGAADGPSKSGKKPFGERTHIEQIRIKSYWVKG